MTASIPQGYHTVTPSLVFKDAAKAIEVYKAAFGATEDYCLKTNGRVMHACITIGNSKIFLCDECPEWGALAPAGSTPVSMYLYVENPDNWHARALKSGCKEIMPVTDMFWGDRVGAVTDPFGYKWNLAAHVRDVSPEELQREADKFGKAA